MSNKVGSNLCVAQQKLKGKNILHIAASGVHTASKNALNIGSYSKHAVITTLSQAVYAEFKQAYCNNA